MRTRPVPCALAVLVAMMTSTVASLIHAGTITVMNADTLNGSFSLPDVAGPSTTVPTDWVRTDDGRAQTMELFEGGVDNGQFLCWTNAFIGWLSSQNAVYTVKAAGEQITASWYIGSNLGLADETVIQGRLVDQASAIKDPTVFSRSGDQSTLGVDLGGTGSFQMITYTTLASDIGKEVGMNFRYMVNWTGKGTQAYLDNVVVTVASPTPEPSSIILLGMGLFGLLAYAWRRHR